MGGKPKIRWELGCDGGRSKGGGGTACCHGYAEVEEEEEADQPGIPIPHHHLHLFHRSSTPPHLFLIHHLPLHPNPPPEGPHIISKSNAHQHNINNAQPHWEKIKKHPAPFPPLPRHRRRSCHKRRHKTSDSIHTMDKAQPIMRAALRTHKRVSMRILIRLSETGEEEGDREEAVGWSPGPEGLREELEGSAEEEEWTEREVVWEVGVG